MRPGARATLALTIALSSASPRASSHGFEPALLDVRELGGGRALVSFRAPTGPADSARDRAALRPTWPARCRILDEREAAASGEQVLSLACGAEGIAGAVIGVDGLRASRADALVRYTPLRGEPKVIVLRPDSPSTRLPGGGGDEPATSVARAYAALGVAHILAGVDHLLFVAGLFLLAGGARAVVLAVTAFTLAHSASLALAALGLIRLRPAPVEASIALSLLLLALELERRARGRPASAAPPSLAFAFGLLHGLGFAGALVAIGLPERRLPLALLAFNVGVEAGQLLFVCALAVLALVVRALAARAADRPGLRRAAALAPAYVIGVTAAWMCLDRIARFSTG